MPSIKTPILGQSYVARSVNAAADVMMNLFPEAVPGEGFETGFLNRAPGLRKLATVGKGPIRALWSHQTNGEDAYVVSGSEVFKIDKSYYATKLGDVTGTSALLSLVNEEKLNSLHKTVSKPT